MTSGGRTVQNKSGNKKEMVSVERRDLLNGRPVLQSLTAINTSFSVGTPTGRHPFVAFFCGLALAVGCFWLTASEPWDGLVF